MLGRAERRRVEAYVEHLQTMLRLQHWTIRLHDDAPDDEGAAASIETVDTLMRASLRLSADWDTYTAGAKREILVHELLHLHHRDVNDVVHQLLPAHYLPSQVYSMLDDAHRRATERMVDALTAVFEGYAPPWPLDPEPNESTAAGHRPPRLRPVPNQPA